MEQGKGMRGRLTVYIFLIAALAVLLSSAVGIWMLRERELEESSQMLRELLELVEAQHSLLPARLLVHSFAVAYPHQQLTLLAADGTVLGDSSLEDQKEHLDRPEVVQALAEGWGTARRQSDTVGVTMFYVAKRFADGVIGRVGMPLSSVYGLVLHSSVVLVVAAVVVLVLAFVLARYLAGHTVRPVERAREAMDETLQMARSEFTANVTHELKTPLTSIRGFTDLLASGMVREEDRQKVLDMISREVERLGKLVDDILKVSELETVGAVPPGEGCDLLTVAGKAAELLAPTALMSQVGVSVTGEGMMGAISADRFLEVALNLMENAIKYNRPGGRVWASVERRGGMAVFTVSDTGIGIPPESRERVFERFYRVDRGRSRAAGGTGLGLAIVKHIVAQSGGSICLDSGVGGGTVVTVQLPLERRGKGVG